MVYWHQFGIFPTRAFHRERDRFGGGKEVQWITTYYDYYEDSLSFLLSSDTLRTCIIYNVQTCLPTSSSRHQSTLATDVNHGGFTSYADYYESYAMMHHACTTESTGMVLPDHKWRCQSSYQTIPLAIKGAWTQESFDTLNQTYSLPLARKRRRENTVTTYSISIS